MYFVIIWRVWWFGDFNNEFQLLSVFLCGGTTGVGLSLYVSIDLDGLDGEKNQKQSKE